MECVPKARAGLAISASERGDGTPCRSVNHQCQGLAAYSFAVDERPGTGFIAHVDDWIPVLSFFGLFLAGWYLGIFVHEMGHASAAVLCGWKPLQVKVGEGPAMLTFAIGDWQFQLAPNPRSGLARMTAQTPAYFRLKSTIVYLGGPVFTAWLAVLLWQTLLSIGIKPIIAPDWLRLCVLLLFLSQAVLLIGCLVPGVVQVDGKVIPNDMLKVWRAVTMKRNLVTSHFAAHVAAEALIYLERGRNDRAYATMERSALAHAGFPSFDAQILWIALLAAEGRAEEANRVKGSLLDAGRIEDKSRVEVLDGLACLPLFYGSGASLEEALDYIEQALREAPDRITLKGTKASLLIELRRAEEGLKLIEEVAANSASENDQAIVLYYKALAVSELGSRAEARGLLHQAIEKYPACVVRSRIEKAILA